MLHASWYMVLTVHLGTWAGLMNSSDIPCMMQYFYFFGKYSPFHRDRTCGRMSFYVGCFPAGSQPWTPPPCPVAEFFFLNLGSKIWEIVSKLFFGEITGRNSFWQVETVETVSGTIRKPFQGSTFFHCLRVFPQDSQGWVQSPDSKSTVF